jgi:hypothetical protein
LTWATWRSVRLERCLMTSVKRRHFDDSVDCVDECLKPLEMQNTMTEISIDDVSVRHSRTHTWLSSRYGYIQN